MCNWADAKLWVGINNAKEHFCCLPPPSYSLLPFLQLQTSFVWTIHCWFWQSSSYFGSSCYLHPQPGSATLLLITFVWVLGDTQASLGFSNLKSKSSSYFGAMPAALLWPPVQMEIIQIIQKEVSASTMLPLYDDRHLSAEGVWLHEQWDRVQ